MKTGRFFVIAVLILITAAVLGLRGRNPLSPDVAQGSQDLTRALLVGHELGQRYQLQIQALGKEARGSETYDWKRLTLTERREVKAKINRYISLLSRVLELDAEKGIYLTHRDQVVSWREKAILYQRAIENFEQIVGESFEPKLDNQIRPVDSRSFEASTKS